MDDLGRKYERAVTVARAVGLSGFIGERDGRLVFKGTVRTQEQAARIWSAIKTVPSWRHEVIGDIQIGGGLSVERDDANIRVTAGDEFA